MTNPRTKAKIEARIHERVAYCIEFELNDPRAAFITVTRVDVSTDLSIAKVYYTVYGTPGDRSKAQHMLADATGFIRKQVGRVLRTRRIPRLAWFYDDTVEYQADMEKKISDALQRDRTINPDAHEPSASEVKSKDEESVIQDEYLDFLKAQEEEEGP